MMMGKPNRRSFFRAIAAYGGFLAPAGAQIRRPLPPSFRGASARNEASLRIRENCAVFEMNQPVSIQTNNGDEASLPGYIACFTKGLPHDQLGAVNPAAYGTLLHAISSGQHSDFENVARGSGMKLIDPQSAYTYELEGLDSHQLACPAAPNLSSAQAAEEVDALLLEARKMYS